MYFENTRARRIAIAALMRAGESVEAAAGRGGWGLVRRKTRWRWYQRPTNVSSAEAAIAPSESQAMLAWPRGITMNAASSGPMAVPVLPPTWKSDWAKPNRPPDASRATREASG